MRLRYLFLDWTFLSSCRGLKSFFGYPLLCLSICVRTRGMPANPGSNDDGVDRKCRCFGHPTRLLFAQGLPAKRLFCIRYPAVLVVRFLVDAAAPKWLVHLSLPGCCPPYCHHHHRATHNPKMLRVRQPDCVYYQTRKSDNNADVGGWSYSWWMEAEVRALWHLTNITAIWRLRLLGKRKH